MPNLLASVEVDKEKRVQCGQPGCGHVVYKAIHIIQEGDELLVLGSTCFAKRYEGFKGLGETIYGGGAGRKLTDAQRELLMNNYSGITCAVQSGGPRTTSLTGRGAFPTILTFA